MNCDHAGKPVPFLPGPGSLESTGHVEVVPADDAVLDKSVAAFGNLPLDLAGLLPDRLPQLDLVDVAQDEHELMILPRLSSRFRACAAWSMSFRRRKISEAVASLGTGGGVAATDEQGAGRAIQSLAGRRARSECQDRRKPDQQLQACRAL